MYYASSWPGLVWRRISALGIQDGGGGHLWPSKPHHTLRSRFLVHFTLCLGPHSSLFWKLFIACVCAPFFYTRTLGTDSWLKGKQERHCSAHESAPIPFVFMSSNAHTLLFTPDVTLHISGNQLFHIQWLRRAEILRGYLPRPPSHEQYNCLPTCCRPNILWKHWPYPAHTVGHRHLLLACSPSCCLDLRSTIGKKGGRNKLLLSFPKISWGLSEEQVCVDSPCSHRKPLLPCPGMTDTHLEGCLIGWCRGPFTAMTQIPCLTAAHLNILGSLHKNRF